MLMMRNLIRKCEGVDCKDCPLYLDDRVGGCPHFIRQTLDLEAGFYMLKHFTLAEIDQLK